METRVESRKVKIPTQQKKEKTIPLSIRFSKKDEEAIANIMAEFGDTTSQAVRRAVSFVMWGVEQIDSGAAAVGAIRLDKSSVVISIDEPLIFALAHLRTETQK